MPAVVPPDEIRGSALFTSHLQNLAGPFGLAGVTAANDNPVSGLAFMALLPRLSFIVDSPCMVKQGRRSRRRPAVMTRGRRDVARRSDPQEPVVQEGPVHRHRLRHRYRRHDGRDADGGQQRARGVGRGGPDPREGGLHGGAERRLGDPVLQPRPDRAAGGAVDARGAQRGGGAPRDRAPQRGEPPLHRDRDPTRPAAPVRRHRGRGPVIHGGGDARDDAGLAGRPGLRAPRRRPLHCQRHLEHRGRDLLDGHLLRRPGRHVPADGAADLQPGPGRGHPGLRPARRRAPRSPRWRRRSRPSTPR